MLRLALPLAVALVATPAGALTLIDDFTTGPSSVFLDVSTSFTHSEGGSMVGGQRTTTLDVSTASGGFAFLRIDGASGSHLSLDSGIDVVHTLTLAYGDPAMNPLGLDLSGENQFAVRFYFSDLPLDVTARVYTTSDAWAEGSGVLAPSLVPAVQNLLFSGFVAGGSDPATFTFANVNEIVFTTHSALAAGANDFRMLELVAVPEGETLALVTAGLAGLALAGRRRERYARAVEV